MAPVVNALQAMRGVALINAITVVAEVGDFQRFGNPRQLMAYLGLVPSEHSSGSSIRRGEITKAGNFLARRALIEGAWTYRMQARVSRKLHDRLEPLSSTSGTSPGRRGSVCAIGVDASLQREAESHRHDCYRPRDGRLHLGNRPRRPAGSRPDNARSPKQSIVRIRREAGPRWGILDSCYEPAWVDARLLE